MIKINIFKQIKETNQFERKTIQEKVIKATEEIGELAEAVLSSNKVSGCEYKNKNVEDVLEESIDLAIVALSIALDIGTVDEVINQFEKKIDKWKNNQLK